MSSGRGKGFLGGRPPLPLALVSGLSRREGTFFGGGVVLTAAPPPPLVPAADDVDGGFDGGGVFLSATFAPPPGITDTAPGGSFRGDSRPMLLLLLLRLRGDELPSRGDNWEMLLVLLDKARGDPDPLLSGRELSLLKRPPLLLVGLNRGDSGRESDCCEPLAPLLLLLR